MIKANQLMAMVLLLCSPLVQAGTIVEIQNQGELTRIMTDGQQARINMSAAEYVIVNYKNHSVRVVDPQKQQVMLLDADTKSAAAANNFPNIRTSMNKLGSGQMIAGYKTQRYSYSANGKSCGVIYGSNEAYQVRGIRELVSAMDAMMEKQRAALGGLAGMIDDCTLADMKLGEYVATIGIPMRTEKNGRVDSEIRSIKTDVDLPVNTFVIPASYKMVTMQDQMNTVTKDMAKAQPQLQGNKNQDQQVQMQQMVRQMQQSGQLTPEMMEQMRRAQDMMKQYQQQR